VPKRNQGSAIYMYMYM